MIADLPENVASAYEQADEAARMGMLALRDLILGTAGGLPSVGRVEEALRWGQPAFLTPEPKAGSSLRIGAHKSAPFALFVHCQTTLIEEYLATFGAAERLDGNRAILFDSVDQIDEIRHGWLIRRALTYHKPELNG